MKHDFSPVLHLLHRGRYPHFGLNDSLDTVLQVFGLPDSYTDSDAFWMDYEAHRSPTNTINQPDIHIRYGCLNVRIVSGIVWSYVLSLSDYPEKYLPEALGQGWMSHFSLMHLEDLREFMLEHRFRCDRVKTTPASPMTIYTRPCGILFNFADKAPHTVKSISQARPHHIPPLDGRWC